MLYALLVVGFVFSLFSALCLCYFVFFGGLLCGLEFVIRCCLLWVWLVLVGLPSGFCGVVVFAFVLSICLFLTVVNSVVVLRCELMRLMVYVLL